MKDDLWTVLVGAFYLGIVYVLVRPNSPGPQLVTSVSNALSDLVKGTTGYGKLS